MTPTEHLKAIQAAKDRLNSVKLSPQYTLLYEANYEIHNAIICCDVAMKCIEKHIASLDKSGEE